MSSEDLEQLKSSIQSIGDGIARKDTEIINILQAILAELKVRK